MNRILIGSIFILFLFSSCTSHENQSTNSLSTSPGTINPPQYSIDSSKHTLVLRFPSPHGYTTVFYDSNSYGHYLQHLSVKPLGSPVKYYDGNNKPGKHIYCSVIDMDIDPVDLQQCADAVMRLRGEYLYGQNR